MDCGLQLGLLWWRTYLDVTPLPTSFAEISGSFKPFTPSRVWAVITSVLSMTGQQTMHANIYFFSRTVNLLG